MKFLPSFLSPKERPSHRAPTPEALRENDNPSGDPQVRKNPETERLKSIGSRPSILEIPGGGICTDRGNGARDQPGTPAHHHRPCPSR